MPVINRPPIGLTDQEILCVIAYLQSLGGTPTVTLQTAHRYYTPAAAPGAAPAAGAPPAQGTAPGAPPAAGATPAAAPPGAAPPAAAPPAQQGAAPNVPPAQATPGTGTVPR